MVVLLAALAVLASPSPVDSRIQESANAAQALQGPLDGSWILRDSGGRVLYVVQIADPAGGRIMTGAWRDARDPSAGARELTAVSLAGGRLSMTFGTSAIRLTLRTRTPGIWRGRLVGPKVNLSVSLERRLVGGRLLLAPAPAG